MATGRLPNLLVAGVPKAGTGSLFAYLAQHPDICASDEKEIGYFNYFNPARQSGRPPPPVESYTRHFAHCTGQRYAVEATPSYSFQGRPVVEAVQRMLTEPRVIITLRDPVRRLWSAYTFQRSLGNIPDIRSFADYLDVCEQRREEGSDLLPHSAVQGLSIGFYADYLDAWLTALGDDLRVVFAEHMAQRPKAVLTGLLEWLDLDTGAVSAMDLRVRNATRHPRSPRMARLAYSAKRRADRSNLIPGGTRTWVRRGYERVNAGSLIERLEPAEARRVEGMYRDSTAATAVLLREHGYTDLPGWLQSSSSDD